MYDESHAACLVVTTLASETQQNPHLVQALESLPTRFRLVLPCCTEVSNSRPVTCNRLGPKSPVGTRTWLGSRGKNLSTSACRIQDPLQDHGRTRVIPGRRIENLIDTAATQPCSGPGPTEKSGRLSGSQTPAYMRMATSAVLTIGLTVSTDLLTNRSYPGGLPGCRGHLPWALCV